MSHRIDRHPWIWLLLGAALLAGAQMRWGIAAFGWLAPAPLLRYLRLTSGWRSRAAFLAATFAGLTVAFLKIVTAPMPPVMALLFAAPATLMIGAPYLAWGRLRARLGGGQAAALFAALAVVAEWAQHALTPFASWGAAAYTQVEDLAFLQLASITGLAGPTFLISLVGATLELTLDRMSVAAPSSSEGGPRSLAAAARPLALAVAAVLAAHAWGSARLSLASTEGESAVLVAAIGTDSDISGLPLPERERTAAWDEALFARTRKAAAAGARLVVWTEAATVVRLEDEEAWLDRARAEVRAAGADTVVAYIMPRTLEPLLYDNKYVLIRADGAIDHAYLKHRPVPGEPATPGEGPMPVVDLGWGRVSGALCYDYDFPRLALEHAGAGVDLVALPSSDWRGIDPIHTQMAAVRAIEGGQSIVRSTRWGLSAGIDHHGRIRGWQSAFDEGERVLLVHLPARGMTTLYGLLGDWFVALCALGGLAAAVVQRARAAGRALRVEPGAPGGLRSPRA